MKVQFTIKVLLLFFGTCFASDLLAHGHGHEHETLKKWVVSNEKQSIDASFLMMKDGDVYLEDVDHQVLHFPIASFGAADQQYILQRNALIDQLNHQWKVAQPTPPVAKEPNYQWSRLFFWWWILPLGALVFWAFGKERKRMALVALSFLTVVLFGFKTQIANILFDTDPAFIDAAFQPFKPAVNTAWDDDWFYVESKGIPDHEMMTGIVKWQQQVPIPQCYIGDNAWQIPLHPVLAATPVPVNPQHFIRGAVAIAANGVPIFNPYTNTGVDALVDGQLDNFGGHSGRADDYHYHIAPLHLDAQTGDILPIAFALDGFSVYGSLEPDGAPMSALDANHGHFGTNGVYHYHGTIEAPYMIGNMVGQVTEDATMQIIPQAKAMPIRPSLTPLNGAVITDCTPNASNNGYVLTYTIAGQTYMVDYSWTPAGVYTYRFTSPTETLTSTYNGFVPCQVPTSTNNLSEDASVVIFPNPTSGVFYLKLPDQTALEAVKRVSVLNLEGALMFSTTLPQPTWQLGPLTKGVYLVKFEFQHGQLIRKVVVQ